MNNGAKTLSDVIRIVERHISALPSARFRLVVRPDGARQEDDWWYVVVQPDQKGVRSYEYSESLTRIEDDIRDTEGVNVLLIPALV